MCQKIEPRRYSAFTLQRVFPSILTTSGAVSLSILIFFLCFQPDKVQSLESGRWFGVISGLLLTSFIIMNMSQLLLPQIFFKNDSKEYRKLAQDFVLITSSLIALGAALFGYFYFLDFIRFNLIAFMKIQMKAVFIGAFPMAAFVILRWHHMLEKNGAAVKAFPEHARHLDRQPSNSKILCNSSVSLRSESGRETVTVFLDDLLLISSADNYVHIFSSNGNGVKKELLRCSLRRVEETLKKYPGIFRCHRTAIVNLKNVKSATGNAQGFRLRFERIDREAPVARSKVQSFRRLYAAHHAQHFADCVTMGL